MTGADTAMTKHTTTHEPFAALKIPEIRYFLGSIAFYTMASRAITVVIGLQIYHLTHSALALGFLGLIEAIPALSLGLFGGYTADRFDRRSILLITRGVSVMCATLLGFISIHPEPNVLSLYAVVFLAGIARGFADPAATAFEAQIVPKELTVNAASWTGSTWLTSGMIGPALIGFSYEIFGISRSYWIIGFVLAMSWLCTCLIQRKPRVAAVRHEPIFKSISLGIKFVFKEQVLVGSMALDLFAVFFGGAVALLPIFATDILHVGARGLGLLEAAPAAGALAVMLYSTHRPPIRHAGRNLLWCVAGFGVSILIFAFSKNFALSLAALFFSGFFDGVSMVIRRSIIRLLSPEHMRGRVASVSMLFIGASNELGAFESGLLAHLIGTVPCVAVGGVITLLVVGLTAAIAPKLRRLGFDHKLEMLAQRP